MPVKRAEPVADDILHIKGAPFGLIYADKTVHGALELDDKELALLRTLRNQAVMAFKQSS